MLERLRQLIDLRDAITFGGLGMVGYGLHLVCPPATWIVCGTALFWLGVRA
jgi:hypothetical protein